MATPDVPAIPEHVEEAAKVAHGFIAQVEHFIAAAKAELSKILPAHVVDEIEATAEQAAQKAIHGE